MTALFSNTCNTVTLRIQRVISEKQFFRRKKFFYARRGKNLGVTGVTNPQTRMVDSRIQ